MTDVTLGDVVFDPVETNDFRASIEGTSNVGKSNTIAVILEDLADVPVPTLVVERLGALTPVRFEVEDLIVVGARDEEGIDLPVPIEDLDRVGKWVLDEGLKILVDISTYADYEEERSRVHLAAAKAIQSLNDRAHEKYRKRGRTRSLLVIDEAHWLAPKDNAPDPPIDDWVKRCRGQIIKASTEGGNKGISVITAFQRRAFIHNGAIQLCDDFVAHKPGPEDIDRTADVLRCDPDTLAGLSAGEIVAKGPALTGGELVGPTKVRRRTSPDPRDETFELPEVGGEVGSFIESIKEDLVAEQERRDRREDELERLRDERDRLQERVDELEQELADTERLASAMDRLTSGEAPAAAADVGEGVDSLRETIEDLRDERDTVVDERDAAVDRAEQAESEVDEMTDRIADLEAEVQEYRSTIADVADHISAVADAVDVDLGPAFEDVPSPAADGDPDVDVDDDVSSYEDFLSADVIRNRIEDAKDHASAKAVRAVIKTIVEDGGPVTYETIQKRRGYESHSTVATAVNALADRDVVEKTKRNGLTHVDLNLDEYDLIRTDVERRRRAEAITEDI